MTDNPMDTAHADDDDEAGPIGPFPNWTAVYASVLIFVIACVAILAWFTYALDFSVTS